MFKIAASTRALRSLTGKSFDAVHARVVGCRAPCAAQVLEPVWKSTSELCYIAEAFVHLHAIDQTQL